MHVVIVCSYCAVVVGWGGAYTAATRAAVLLLAHHHCCLQELGPDKHWVSEAIFGTLFGMFAVWTFSPFVTQRKRFYTVVMWSRLLMVLVGKHACDQHTTCATHGRSNIRAGPHLVPPPPHPCPAPYTCSQCARRCASSHFHPRNCRGPASTVEPGRPQRCAPGLSTGQGMWWWMCPDRWVVSWHTPRLGFVYYFHLISHNTAGAASEELQCQMLG
jgi:hypothetical protein